jgi:hypothetical protein
MNFRKNISFKEKPGNFENIDDAVNEDSEFPEEMFSMNAAIQIPRIN